MPVLLSFFITKFRPWNGDEAAKLKSQFTGDSINFPVFLLSSFFFFLIFTIECPGTQLVASPRIGAGDRAREDWKKKI